MSCIEEGRRAGDDPSAWRHHLSGPPIPEGVRNTTLTQIAGRLRYEGVDGEEMAHALHAINRARCVPPQLSAEVFVIAKWINRKPLGTGTAKGAVSDEEREATRAQIAELIVLLDRVPFRGPSGAAERDVVAALLAIAADAGTMECTASQRQLAERAGIDRRTVARMFSGARVLRTSLRPWIEIEQLGWRAPVRNARDSIGTRGTRWRIRAPQFVAQQLGLSQSDSNNGSNHRALPLLVTQRDSDLSPDHDAWRTRGLGKIARRALIELLIAPAGSVRELSARLNVSSSSAGRALQRLASVGMAEKIEEQWIATPAADDLNGVVQRLPSAGTAERQRAAHQSQRENFVEARIRPRRARNLTVVDAHRARDNSEKPAPLLHLDVALMSHVDGSQITSMMDR
jgi:DNA-binding transcriptional regulator YhcF (GntR family)